MKARISPFAFASTIVLCLAAPLHADTYNWNGSTTGGATGASNTWNTTTANWTGTGTLWPTTGTDNDAVFAGTAGTVTISGGVTANDLTFNTAGYRISGGTLTLASNGASTPAITNAVTAEIASVVAGSALITKAGSGTLILSASNTFTGALTGTAGVVRITNSNGLGTGGKTITARINSARIELDGTGGAINLPSGIVFNTSGVALRNIAGNNTIVGRVDMGNGSGNTTIGSNGGTLTLTGLIRSSNSGSRSLVLDGTSTSQNKVAGVIQDNTSIISLSKSGPGRWIVSGANTFTGSTTVSAGNLTVTSATGLGLGTNIPATNATGGNVTLSANANFSYAPAVDASLAIGGNFAVTGASTTTIGCAIGSTATSASIHVTGDATITDAAHTVDLYMVPGITPVTDTYTLISAAGGASSLNPATTPTLGKVYNNSNFTVGAFTPIASALQVNVTAVAPLTDAYWVGGFSGGPSVWAISDGAVNSNWADSAGGSAQALVPGASTNVVISGDSPSSPPTATVLGANMTINSLTISDTANGFGLNDDGNQLTLLAGGMSMGADVPTSTIAAKVAIDGDQAWSNHSANDLIVSGIISGSSILSKTGTGKLVFSGANSLTGSVQVTEGALAINTANSITCPVQVPGGTLSLGNINALASATLSRNVSDNGVLTYDAGAGTYNLGALSGDGTLDVGGNTLSIGGKNTNTVFSGSLENGALTKVGTGTLTLSGVSTFSGAVNVNAGRLKLANSSALGTGPKTLTSAGGDRVVELSGGITLGSDVTLEMSSNSYDGAGLSSINGNNTIEGKINFTFGLGSLNISSSTGSTLTLNGNVELITASRGMIFGGGSTNDNTVNGNIIQNTAGNVLSVTKQSAGKWIFSGANSYRGNTNVIGGTLVFASGGSQAFYPKSDASSNKITGSATVLFDGALNIDLTDAASAPSETSWLLVEVASLNESFDTHFTVTDFTEVSAGTWTKVNGLDTYTFTESDGRLVKTTASGSPFENWMSSNYSSLTNPDNLPDADPDGDGVSNLAEFALGGDPTSRSNNGLVRSAIDTISGTNHLTYTFACRSDASFSGSGPAVASQDGVDYTVRASFDLSAFTLAVDEVSPAITTGLPTVPTGYSYRTFRVTDPTSSQPKAFIQLGTGATAP